MARSYSRDNRGRFAGKGAGATARGGRLKTAAGNKRATQTQTIQAGSRAGVVSKPAGLKPGSIKPKTPAPKAKPDRFSESAFKTRAQRAEARRAVLSKELATRDPQATSTLKLKQRVGNLENAVSSYAAVNRKAAQGEFTRQQVFQSLTSKRSTAPKLSPSEKAAETRRRKKEAENRKQIKMMENARRWG